MLNVCILMYDDVELLDFAGPYEVFTTASRVAQRHGDPAPFHTFTAAQALTVQARAGLKVQADHQWPADNSTQPLPDIHLLIVPGGVTQVAQGNDALLQWLARSAAGARITASVCTGVFLLAQAGVVQSGPVTTHWEDIADLKRQFPSLDVIEGVRFVDRGRLCTSAGISAGIDLALHLVARCTSQALARDTARQMDYHWQPDTQRIIEEAADGVF